MLTVVTSALEVITTIFNWNVIGKNMEGENAISVDRTKITEEIKSNLLDLQEKRLHTQQVWGCSITERDIVWTDTSRGSKEPIDPRTTPVPSIWTIIIHTSYWSMVFSCLEVVLKHEANKKGKTSSQMWRRPGKNWLSFYSHDLFACHSTGTWHEGKNRGNLSNWDNNAALVGIYQLNMLMKWQSEWKGDWCTQNKKEFNLSHYNGWKRRIAQEKNSIVK